MDRSNYTMIDNSQGLTEKSQGSLRSITRWKRLKSFLPKSFSKSATYFPVRNCKSIQPAGEHTADFGAESGSDNEENVDKAEAHSEPSTSPISILFTHNQPCREIGEDEDFRCLWLTSSEEDDEDDGMDEDEISVSSWTRPV
ncbi:hypothetical protein BHE90_017634 [Fusarium euwallaceae]|uniref:Uncharacterized protein n=1 Tax=Fusarium euwallaceae TaxID=1147111 RepID=A0A430KWW6_9HYPO|nr:hypothetical protein BHE90_017634 [Fusarium euwallaceae]